MTTRTHTGLSSINPSLSLRSFNWLTTLSALAACAAALALAPTARAQDSDGDGVSDATDNCPLIANANQSDCDSNGVGDACQSSVARSTGNMGAFGSGVTASGALTGVASSLWPVRLTVKAVGDLNLPTEFATLRLADTVITSTLFQQGASDCPAQPDQATIVLTAAQWNALVDASTGGTMTVSIVGNTLVNASQCPGAMSEVIATFTVSPDCNQNDTLDYCDIATGTAADCNANGMPDTCDIVAGLDRDCDANGRLDRCDVLQYAAADDNQNCTPDVCEYARGDFGLDGSVDGKDLGYMLASWGSADPFADLDGNQLVNGADLGTLLTNWGATPFGGGLCLGTPTWATLLEYFPDPAVVTNPTLRAAIIFSGRPWRVRDTATQMEMLLVPPGMFTMGCTASNQYRCDSIENPTHSVTLTQAFYLGRYEVTQGQWVAKMGSNPSYFAGQSDSASRPVEQVSWNIIQGYLSATGMRLPSEAEWEYACRAGTTTAFNNGSSDDATVGTIAWYSSNSGNQTHAVGGKAANELGFHDMSGNVWEWVNDWYEGYSSGAQTNPLGPVSGSYRVFRGGAWAYITYGVRSSYRNGFTPGFTDNIIGFRVAKTP
jgi:formylglycine-generating enzyme required for sulfatase activity